MRVVQGVGAVAEGGLADDVEGDFAHWGRVLAGDAGTEKRKRRRKVGSTMSDRRTPLIHMDYGRLCLRRIRVDLRTDDFEETIDVLVSASPCPSVFGRCTHPSMAS